MPIEKPRRALKMELDPAGDNLLEQLVAAMARIESGLRGIHELLESVIEVDDGDHAARVRSVQS
jgi:hypothetical protein